MRRKGGRFGGRLYEASSSIDLTHQCTFLAFIILATVEASLRVFLALRSADFNAYGYRGETRSTRNAHSHHTLQNHTGSSELVGQMSKKTERIYLFPTPLSGLPTCTTLHYICSRGSVTFSEASTVFCSFLAACFL